MASLGWSTVAQEELAAMLIWLDEHRGSTIAASALAAIDRAAQAAAVRPLAYAWVGAVLPPLSGAPRNYRRVQAWGRRVQLFYRYT